jgi:hypothetical protein
MGRRLRARPTLRWAALAVAFAACLAAAQTPLEPPSCAVGRAAAADPLLAESGLPHCRCRRALRRRGLPVTLGPGDVVLFRVLDGQTPLDPGRLE